MGPRRRVVPEYRVGLLGSLHLRLLSSGIPPCLRELIVSLLWWDEDGCRSATVEVGIMTGSLVRNVKHPVDVIVSGVESGGPDLNCQLIHLVLCDLFDSGECPLLAQHDTKRTHGIEHFRCSTTSLQVERDGVVHLVCKVIP